MTAATVPLAVCAACVLGGAAVWYALSAPRPTPAEEPADHAAPAPSVAAPSPALGTVEETAPPGEEVEMLVLPDGSKVPPLNGVKKPGPMTWNNPEWSPIVGTEHGNGIDWYVHADGTRSTTVMLWRSDLGRHDAITWTFHPRDPVPTAPLPDDPTSSGR